MSAVLGKIPIKNEIFPEFRGEIKSLGAWGGDFLLVSSNEDENYIHKYFNSKGLNTIFAFADLIL